MTPEDRNQLLLLLHHSTGLLCAEPPLWDRAAAVLQQALDVIDAHRANERRRREVK
jgi:hypothetical protein